LGLGLFGFALNIATKQQVYNLAFGVVVTGLRFISGQGVTGLRLGF
jgi:hypothetical protein